MRSVDAWGATYPGRKPGPNQDSVLIGKNVLRQGQTFEKRCAPFAVAVADGVSGDPGGEVASEAALSVLAGYTPYTLNEVMALLEAANAHVCGMGRALPGLENMCTTLSAVWICEDRIVWCARGDTPIYFITDRRVVQISHPHNDAFGQLTSYIGADSEIALSSTDCAVVTHGLRTIRAVCVMSDGVSRFVNAALLKRLAAEPEKSVSWLGMHLMRKAFSAGSYDNLSFVMARISAEG